MESDLKIGKPRGELMEGLSEQMAFYLKHEEKKTPESLDTRGKVSKEETIRTKPRGVLEQRRAHLCVGNVKMLISWRKL